MANSAAMARSLKSELRIKKQKRLRREPSKQGILPAKRAKYAKIKGIAYEKILGAPEAEPLLVYDRWHL
jgi:hypothetical protein